MYKRQIDNNVYYMLTPDAHYYNFSGCGNVMNCNHPVVRSFIIDCLRPVSYTHLSPVTAKALSSYAPANTTRQYLK